MDRVELYMITINIAITTIGWIKKGIAMQSMTAFITKQFAVNSTPEISMRAFYEI